MACYLTHTHIFKPTEQQRLLLKFTKIFLAYFKWITNAIRDVEFHSRSLNFNSAYLTNVPLKRCRRNIFARSMNYIIMQAISLTVVSQKFAFRVNIEPKLNRLFERASQSAKS